MSKATETSKKNIVSELKITYLKKCPEVISEFKILFKQKNYNFLNNSKTVTDILNLKSYD